jgi:hypothetical protein
MDYAGIAAAVAAAVFWTQGAQVEGISPLVWVGASLAISVFVMAAMHHGWPGVVAGQLAMFVAITLYRTLRDDKPQED